MTGALEGNPVALARAHDSFVAAWPAAQSAFSPFTRLLPPIYCHSVADEKREGLSGSFAMIRMRDDRIVIGLRQIVEFGLESHAHAILAHEVGHYVHAPGSLLEHARLFDRVRRCLPDAVKSYAGVVANLYTDLLLNDRLQRSASADVAAVYRALRKPDPGRLWCLYMRVYERLWRLPSDTLAPPVESEIDADAELGARIIRLFRDRFIDGAASFTKLVAPYFEELSGDAPILPAWLDTAGSGAGERVPDGLVEDDFDPDEVAHPALDERIADAADEGGDDEAQKPKEKQKQKQKQKRNQGHQVPARARRGDGSPDRRKVRRDPQAYLELLRSLGVAEAAPKLVARYYRELAMPHVIPFPAKVIARAGEPLPEGLEPWAPGSPLERIDWLQSLLRSPVVIPGVTTVERAYGTTAGGEPERRPPDLYVGIDCSGSMGNPAHQLAFPVVAGVVLTLSALRAGARVMACLSGEWRGTGAHVETPGFIRDEARLFGVLTDYLGTGASFGLGRLATTFAQRLERPAHLLVVSDSDFFGEIEGTKDGWQIARAAVENAGAGASAVLRLSSDPHHAPWLEKLRDAGFTTYIVSSEVQLIEFARAFARRTFAFEQTSHAPGGAAADFR